MISYSLFPKWKPFNYYSISYVHANQMLPPCASTSLGEYYWPWIILVVFCSFNCAGCPNIASAIYIFLFVKRLLVLVGLSSRKYFYKKSKGSRQ